jgi:hypothetical protein
MESFLILGGLQNCLRKLDPCMLSSPRSDFEAYYGIGSRTASFRRPRGRCRGPGTPERRTGIVTRIRCCARRLSLPSDNAVALTPQKDKKDEVYDRVVDFIWFHSESFFLASSRASREAGATSECVVPRIVDALDRRGFQRLIGNIVGEDILFGLVEANSSSVHSVVLSLAGVPALRGRFPSILDHLALVL